MNLAVILLVVFYFLIFLNIYKYYYQVTKTKKQLLLYLFVFITLDVILCCFINDLCSLILLVLFCQLLNHEDMKRNCFICLFYIVINDMISFFIISLIVFCFKNNIYILFNNTIILILLSLIIGSVEYLFWNLNLDRFKIFFPERMDKIYIPIFILHMIIYISRSFINSYKGIYVVELYSMQSLLYIMLIIINIFIVYYFVLKEKYEKQSKQQYLYKKEIELLLEVIQSTSSFHDDLHDMYYLLLKCQNQSTEIQQYIKNKKTVLRFLSIDQHLNMIMNTFFNISYYKDIQIKDELINQIDIDYEDLLILFYEIFNQLKNQNIILYIQSVNYLQIQIDYNDFHVTKNLRTIVNQYNGHIESNKERIIMILYYTDKSIMNT